MSKGLCVTATAWQLLAFSQPQPSSTSSTSSGDAGASTPNPRPNPGPNHYGTTTSPAASWTSAVVTGGAESERIRARERLEASVAALRELQLLREEREARVREALTRPTTQRPQPQRRGRERCYGRGPGRSDGKADDALLAVGRDLELIKEQLQCELGKPCALERPLSELRVDTDGTDVDSRPSSGFYSMSEDGSLSLSNSCSSISSSGPAPAPHAPSTSTPSSSVAPAATTTTTGQLPVRLRRPAARPRPQERPRSAVELPSFLRTTGQQQHHHQQQRSPKAKAGPCRPQSSYDLGDGSNARTSPVGLADPVTSAPGRDPDPRFRRDLRSRDGSEVYRYPSPLHAIAMQSSAFLHRRGDDHDAAAAESPDGKPPTSDRTRRRRRHDDAGADDEGSATVAAPPGADKATAYIAALLKRRGQKTRRRTSGAGASAAVVERKASDAAETSGSPSAEVARGRPITNLSVRYKHGAAAAAASPVPAATAHGVGGPAGSAAGGSGVNLARSPRGAGGTLPALVRPASIAHFDTSRYHDDGEDDDGGGDDGGGGGDDDERRWRASGPHVHPGAGDRRSSSGKSPNLQQQQQQQSTDRERERRRRALASVSMDLRPQRGAGWWGAAAEPTVGAPGWQQGELGRPQYQQRVARICKLGHGSWAGSLPKSLDLRGGYRHRQDDDGDDDDDGGGGGGASDRRRPGNAARSSSSKRHRLREGVELVRQSFRLPGRRRRASGERASSELDVSGGRRQLTEQEEAAGASTAFDYRQRLVLHPSEVRGIGAAGTRAGGHRRWCSTMEIARGGGGGGGGGNDDDDAGGDVGTPLEPPRWLVRAGARDGAWSPTWAVRGHADASPGYPNGHPAAGYPNVYPAAGCPGELLQRSAIAEMSEDDADEEDGAAGRLPADGSAEPRSSGDGPGSASPSRPGSGSAEGPRGPCRVSQQVRAVPSAVKRKIRQRIADAAKTSTDV